MKKLVKEFYRGSEISSYEYLCVICRCTFIHNRIQYNVLIDEFDTFHVWQDLNEYFECDDVPEKFRELVSDPLLEIRMMKFLNSINGFEEVV